MKKLSLLIAMSLCLGIYSVQAQCDMTVTATTNSSLICYGDSARLNAIPSAGTRPYTYLWTPSAGLNCDTCKRPYAAPLTNTTYTVTVKDKHGCTSTASVNISVDPQLYLTVSASNLTTFKGDTVHLNAAVSGGTAPYTYKWTPAAPLNNSVIYNPYYVTTNTKTFTCKVEDNAGCIIQSSITINVTSQPAFNADTLLEEVLTNQPPSAIGGTPPYTYNFSPPVSTSFLVSPPDTAITFTVTVTDANGCHTTDTAKYIPVLNKTIACGSIFISEYIQDTANHNDGIELFNPTGSPIHLNNYYLFGTTNGSLFAPPFIIQLHGIIRAHSTFLIANRNASIALTSRAKMLSDSLNFGGKDIVALATLTISHSGLSFTPLDEVGTISPLPTDSGWSVYPSGSTKNHTLVRKGNVVQGSLLWAASMYQWNVYPQGTFNYIGRYKSSCTTGDPNLTLAFANATSVCGSNRTFDFDIMVSSDVPTWFDNCLMYIAYDGAAFGNNIVANSNVTVTAYPNFGAPTYLTPTGNFIDLSPDTLDLPFGTDQSQSSWTREQITSTPQKMLHVSINIQDCSSSPSIFFTDTSFLQIFPFYTLNQGDSSIYGLPYNVTYFNGGLNNILCQMNITDFPDTIRAGIGDTLTITGGDFGNTRGTGQVKFYDADTSNYRIQKLNVSDYLSWTNNQIKIRLPAFADTVLPSTGRELAIGGNNFIVKNSCGDSAVSGNNSHGNPFSVYYNLEQFWNPNNNLKEELLLRSIDTNGGYVIRFDSVTFPKGSVQRAIFYKAMRDWTCYTGVNWVVGKDTSFNFTFPIFVGVNYVSMGTLSANDVAETYRDPNECTNFTDILSQAVIIFNSGESFVYDTTETVTINNGQADFYGVSLHELGHFIGLEHDVVTSHLMYWTANTNHILPANRITLASAASGTAVEGGFYSVRQSEAVPSTCGSYGTMSGKSTACVNEYTSIKDIVPPNNTNFTVYPNPSNGIFTIDGNVNNYNLVVMNMLGQVIYSQKIHNEKAIIDISTQPNGMYFVQEQYQNGRATQKIIITKK